jgi:hypothetical protein
VPRRLCRWVGPDDVVQRLYPGEVWRAPPRGSNSRGMPTTSRHLLEANSQMMPRPRELAVAYLFAAADWRVGVLPSTLKLPSHGTLCMFLLTERSLDTLMAMPRVTVSGVPQTLVDSLLNVEPDDRFLVRKLPPGKWRVKIEPVKAPFPVMVLQRARSVEMVTLDHPVTEVKDAELAWFTVPVLDLDDSRTSVSIER